MLVGGLLAVAAGLLMAGPACGLVLLPEDEGPPAVKPTDDVVGLWLDDGQAVKGSCVAIGSSYVITTRHQGYGPGWTVKIGGVPYPLLEVFDHVSADLRIARISDTPVLASAVSPYEGATQEWKSTNKPVVIGGYGKSRGAALTYDGETYGYTWTAVSDKSLRWGANKVDNYGQAVFTRGSTTMTSDVLTAHFDGPGWPAHVSVEAVPAEGDSGGGWFYNVGTDASPDWRLMALSRGNVDHGSPPQSWFQSPDGSTTGDIFDGVRIKYYAGWLKGVINPSTWVGGSGTWSTASQWSPAGVPNKADAWAVFGTSGAGPLTVTLGANVTVGTLRFDGATNYTISTATGRTLTFDASSDSYGNPGNAGIEVNRMQDPLSTVSATIAVPMATDIPLALRQNSSGVLTLSGSISGAGSLTTTGDGLVVLANTNTFSGGVTLKAGTLRVTAAGGLGSGPVTLYGGALDFRRDASTAYGNGLTAKANASINVDRNVAGSGQTITLGSLTVAGDWKLTCTGASGYALAFSGATAFQGTGASTIQTDGADVALSGGATMVAGSLTKAGASALTLAGPQSWGSGTRLNVNGGTVHLSTDMGTTNFLNVSLNVSGAGSLADLKTTQHVAAVNLSASGAAALASGSGKVLVTKALTIDGAASQLDLAANSLVIKYSGTSPLDQVAGWVRTGYNQGQWNGGGIVSSAAAVDQTVYAVGYMPNNPQVYTQFAGEPVDSSTVLARYTYVGDVNLDGKVDDNDVTLMVLSYDRGATTGRYWFQGDIARYDGRVDDNDITLLVLNYRRGIGQPLGEPADSCGGTLPLPAVSDFAADAGTSLVPEPATLALLALGGLALAARRPGSRSRG